MAEDRVQQVIDQIVVEAWGDAEAVDPTVREVVVARFQVGWNSRTSALLLGDAGGYEEFPSFVSDALFDELRFLTATPDGGAWFTFRLRVTVEEMTTEFDFDGPPDFISMMVFPEDVEVELTNWPRDPSRVPGWLTAAEQRFN